MCAQPREISEIFENCEFFLKCLRFLKSPENLEKYVKHLESLEHFMKFLNILRNT